MRSAYPSLDPTPRWRRPLLILATLIVMMGAWQVGRFWRDHAEAAQAETSNEPLQGQIQTIAKANPQVTIGAAVINLDSGKLSTYGETQAVTTASTTKILTAADFLHETENGTYKLSGPLGDATAAWQLQEMVNQSDDDSWALFNNLLGGDQLTAYARSIGLDSYDYNSNSISPSDEATLLQKLYQGQLLNSSDTKLLLSYMQHTNDEALIPAALPSGVTVYHKYGELLEDSGNYVNDAAIIIDGQHRFVLTIYTDRSDMLDITTREDIIHQITKDVLASQTTS